MLLAFAVLTVIVPFVVSAQSGTPPAGGKSTEARRSPLPSYFGKIAVSDAQRETLYAIQDDYEAKINALQLQVKALLKEREDKMESVLTPGQKLRMAELREEARQKAAKPKAGDGPSEEAAVSQPEKPKAE